MAEMSLEEATEPGGAAAAAAAAATAASSVGMVGSLQHLELRILREVDRVFSAGATSYQVLKSVLGGVIGPPLFEMFKERIQGRLQELHSGAPSTLGTAPVGAALAWTMAPASAPMETHDENTDPSVPTHSSLSAAETCPPCTLVVDDAMADLILRISGARSRMHVIDLLFASRHLLTGITMPPLGFVPMKQVQKDLLREEFVIGGERFNQHLVSRRVALASPRPGQALSTSSLSSPASPALSPSSHRAPRASEGGGTDSVGSGFEVLEKRLLVEIRRTRSGSEEGNFVSATCSSPPPVVDPEAVAWAVQAMSRTIHGGDSFFHVHALFKSVNMVLTPCGEQVQQSQHKTSVNTFFLGDVSEPPCGKAEEKPVVEGSQAGDPILEVVTHNLYDLRPPSSMGSGSSGPGSGSAGLARDAVWLALDVVICHYRNMRTGRSVRTMDIQSPAVCDYADTLQFLLDRGAAGFGLCRRCHCHRMLALCTTCALAGPNNSGTSQIPSKGVKRTSNTTTSSSSSSMMMMMMNSPGSSASSSSSAGARAGNGMTVRDDCSVVVPHHRVHPKSFAREIQDRFVMPPGAAHNQRACEGEDLLRGGGGGGDVDVAKDGILGTTTWKIEGPADRQERRQRHAVILDKRGGTSLPITRPPSERAGELIANAGLLAEPESALDSPRNSSAGFKPPPLLFDIRCSAEPVVPTLLDSRRGTGYRMIPKKLSGPSAGAGAGSGTSAAGDAAQSAEKALMDRIALAQRLPAAFPACTYVGRCRVGRGLELLDGGKYLEPYVDNLAAITDVSVQDFVPADMRGAFTEHLRRRHATAEAGTSSKETLGLGKSASSSSSSSVPSLPSPPTSSNDHGSAKGLLPWDPARNCVSFHLCDEDATYPADKVLLEFTCAVSVRVFLLWPHLDGTVSSPDPLPKWLRDHFKMEPVAYPCHWDGYASAQRNEKAAQVAAERRKLNEAMLEKQRANNVRMLDILGSHAEMAGLQAELGAIISSSTATTTTTTTPVAGSVTSALPPSVNGTAGRDRTESEASAGSNTAARPVVVAADGSSVAAASDPEQLLRRSRGFFELWKSREVFPPFSHVQLPGAGLPSGQAGVHNYFVVVVNQDAECTPSPPADSMAGGSKPKPASSSSTKLAGSGNQRRRSASGVGHALKIGGGSSGGNSPRLSSAAKVGSKGDSSINSESDPWAARFQAALKKNTIAAAVNKRHSGSFGKKTPQSQGQSALSRKLSPQAAVPKELRGGTRDERSDSALTASSTADDADPQSDAEDDQDDVLVDIGADELAVECEDVDEDDLDMKLKEQVAARLAMESSEARSQPSPSQISPNAAATTGSFNAKSTPSGRVDHTPTAPIKFDEQGKDHVTTAKSVGSSGNASAVSAKFAPGHEMLAPAESLNDSDSDDDDDDDDLDLLGGVAVVEDEDDDSSEDEDMLDML